MLATRSRGFRSVFFLSSFKEIFVRQMSARLLSLAQLV